MLRSLIKVLIIFLMQYISGEFGIVYKGYYIYQGSSEFVAIKTLKGTIVFELVNLKITYCLGMVGFIHNEAVQELFSECLKMKNLNHPRVMTLKGVCLDGGPVPYIVLPYMTNGSLLSYLKKERQNLTVSMADMNDGEENSQQLQVSIIL